jgi:hypothetical protein
VASSPRSSEQAAIAQGTATGLPPVDSRPRAPVLSPRIELIVNTAPPSSFATGYAARHRLRRAKCSKRQTLIGGERGIRSGRPIEVSKLLIIRECRPLQPPQNPEFGT